MPSTDGVLISDKTSQENLISDTGSAHVTGVLCHYSLLGDHETSPDLNDMDCWSVNFK